MIPDPAERVQCYSVFGIDGKRMNNYYETVSQLEGQLTSDFQQGGELLAAASHWFSARTIPNHFRMFTQGFTFDFSCYCTQLDHHMPRGLVAV